MTKFVAKGGFNRNIYTVSIFNEGGYKVGQVVMRYELFGMVIKDNSKYRLDYQYVKNPFDTSRRDFVKSVRRICQERNLRIGS